MYTIEDYEGGVFIQVATQGQCYAVRQETVQKLLDASDLLDLHCAIELIKSECRLENE